MLYDDQPISQDEEDKLNRTPFVDEIVELIDRYTDVDEKKDNHDGLVIGLEGDWGSGKTSVLNLLENRFQDKNERYVVQRLDSWLAIDRTTLAAEFFKTLGVATIESGVSSEYETQLQRIVRNVWGYTLRFVTWIKLKKLPKIGPKIVARIDKMEPSKWVRKTPAHVLKFGKKVIRSVTISVKVIKIDLGKIIEDTTLRKEKEGLRVDLSKSKKYIIYMIDDIDRLSNDEIGFVMQLVKNIADFPKVIYILAYDRAIVGEALQCIDGRNGRDFMEKIVQVPIQMPMFSEQDLLNYFGKELRNIIPEKSYTENKAIYYTMPGKAIENRIHKALLPYLRSIRDCNRVLNAFQVRYLICYQFCDADDLLCIVVLSIYEPELISYIINHPDSVYPQGINQTQNSSEKPPEKYREECKDKAQRSDDALNILAILFPGFSKKDALHVMTQTPDAEAVIKNKISIKPNFSSYFILSGREDDVLSSTVEYLLKEADETSIRGQFVAWAKNGQWTGAYRKIVSYCDTRNKLSLTKDRLKILLHALSLLKDNPLFDQQLRPYADLAWYFLEKATGYSPFSGTTIILGTRQQNMVTELFEDQDISIEVLDALMKHIGHGYEWNPSEANGSYPPLADKEVFEACRDIFLRRKNSSISSDEEGSKK